MCSYSCRTSALELLEFQQAILTQLTKKYPTLYSGDTINLDFHSIPHFGVESEMEQVWCGSRGKAMKGANTFFAQDGTSDTILYSRADITRKESSDEIKSFVDYWLSVKGIVDETLVFDSKLTRYDILYDIDHENVKFITLRTRSKKLIQEALAIPEDEWERVYLPIPKRKHKHVMVHQNQVSLIAGKKTFRQLIIKDHGRSEPTFVITNREDLKLSDILTIYARRCHIENKLADLVHFFNLNNLSCPIMIRIQFDILWTVIADTLYHLFAQDLRRFDKCTSGKTFKQFVNMPGQINYDGDIFLLKIRKRTTTPILREIKKLNQGIYVPWLDGKLIKIQWTA